jgi:hypothetical protein
VEERGCPNFVHLSPLQNASCEYVAHTIQICFFALAVLKIAKDKNNCHKNRCQFLDKRFTGVTNLRSQKKTLKRLEPCKNRRQSPWRFAFDRHKDVPQKSKSGAWY